ncbi:MAG: iron export ABC transporter permease subunit FetB [Alphaproteobacteria bacterium]|nr:iron export ABC transporter permease subunit FetB [Alphaproteobacteria bacterium]
MNGYIALSYWDLVIAAVFLLLNGILSFRFHLGLERQLLVASVRMVIQLLLVGLLLKTIFAIASFWLTMLTALAMCGFAGREIWARQERRLRGIWGHGIGTGVMMVSGMTIILVALTTQIQPDPWWSPRYALPLFGMILGNTMTGISLGLNALNSTVPRERVAIEAQLLLGQTNWQAVAPFLQHALRIGFTPIINAMAATGVVSLPGMMTGQILSGVAPEEAVKYQLLIMFLIGGATGLGVLGSVLMSAWRLTDDRHRLRLDRLG